MAENAAEGLRLLTDAKGRLLLVQWLRGRTDHETMWLCLSTSGHRDLVIHNGTCVHDGAARRDVQVVRAARRTVAAMDPSQSEGPILAKATRLLLDRPQAEDPDRDRILSDLVRARFREACGEATVQAAMSGIAPKALDRIDGEAGADIVDGAARAIPFLAPLVAAGSGMESIQVEHVLHAVKARDEGSAAEAAWRLAWKVFERLPNGGPSLPQAIEQDWDGFEDFDLGEEDEALARPRAPAPPLPPVPDNVRLLLARLGEASLPWPLAACAILGCAHVPADWLPRDREAARDFAVCAYLAERMSRCSSGALDQRGLLAAARGRWAGFAKRATASTSLAELLGKGDPWHPWISHPGKGGACSGAQEVEALARMLGDMVGRFRKQVAIPAVALRQVHGLPGAAAPQVAERAVWRLLLGGKSLPAVTEAIHRWHGRRDAMDRVMRTIGDGRSWPRPFPDFLASNGVAAVPLLDAKALAEEGARLRHCVADYADGCVRERIAIVSLRPPPGGGAGSTAELSWVRLAPAAVARGWAPRVLQHRTTLNGTPGGADVAALNELVAWLGSGEAWSEADGPASPRADRATRLALRIDRLARRIAHGPEYHDLPDDPEDDGDEGRYGAEDPHGDDGDPIAEGCGYDWRRPEQLDTAIDAWAPFLPRQARGGARALAGPLGLAPWPEAAMPAAAAPAAGVRGRPGWPRPGPLPRACWRLAKSCVSIRWVERQNPFVVWLGLCVAALLVVGMVWAWASSSDHAAADGGDERPVPPVVEMPSASDAEARRTAKEAERRAGLELRDRLARYLAMPASPCPEGTFAKVVSVPSFRPMHVPCHGAGLIRVRAYGGTIEAAYVPEGIPPVVVVEAKALRVDWISDAWRERTLATMAAEGVPARPLDERAPLGLRVPGSASPR